MGARLIIDINKIKDNARQILGECGGAGVSVAAVTKMHRADRLICEALLEAGIKILADSRIENLAKIADIPCEKWLIRIPALSECERVVDLADLSLNSEIAVIRELDKLAGIKGKTHGVLLMFDLGDLREGYFKEEDLLAAAKETLELKNIRLRGIGTNLSCYGGIKPTFENLSRLVAIARRIQKELSVKLDYISGGSSTSFSLVREGKLPEGINNLRIGDSILIGRDDLTRQYIPSMHSDCFVLECEIVEIKEKPSVPIGETGIAALNRLPVFTDKGIRKRAICSVGRQDIDTDMEPLDEKIELLEASSDHLLADITDCDKEYKIGDRLRFKMKYTSAMRAFTGEYIVREYIK
ncbi:MAG: alanine/ornithine racemase family PLP-dependent enzyme [Eubacteriaceae bacterium]|nr:alanine/ornithine racemase family PLP-dependent enzyme [Eubacteriaceae bacterium]